MDGDARSPQQATADSNGAVSTELRKDVPSPPGNVQEDSNSSSQVEQVSSSSREEDGAPPAGAPEEVDDVSVDSSLSEDENSQTVYETMSDSASPARVHSVSSATAKEVAEDLHEGTDSTADDEQVVSSVESAGPPKRHESTADVDDEQDIAESPVLSEAVATDANEAAPELHDRLDDTAESDTDSVLSPCMPSGIHVSESGHDQDDVETDMIHSPDISGSMNEGSIAGQPDPIGQDGISSSDVSDPVEAVLNDAESLEIPSPPEEECLQSPIDLAVSKEIASATMEASDTNDEDVPRNVTDATTAAVEMSRANEEAEIAGNLTASQSDSASAGSSESTQPETHTGSETADDSFEYVGSSVVEDSVHNEAVNKEHRPVVSITHEGLLNADQASPVFSTPNWEGQLPWNSSVDNPESSALPETLEESDLSKKQLTRQDNVPGSISGVAEDNDVPELDVTQQTSAPDVGELDEGGTLDQDSGTPPVTQMEDPEALQEKPETFSPDGPLVPNPVSVPDVITYYESIFPKKSGKEDCNAATDGTPSVPTIQTSDVANVPDVTIQASLVSGESVNDASESGAAKLLPSSSSNKDDIPEDNAAAFDSNSVVAKLQEQEQEQLPVYDNNPETYSSIVGPSSLLEDLVALPQVACIVGSIPGSAGDEENIDRDGSDTMTSDYVQAAPMPVFHPIRQELVAVQHVPSTPSKDADEPFDDGTASRESPASTKSPCDSPPAITDSPCDSPHASTDSPCDSPPVGSDSGPGPAGGSGFVYDPADFEPEPKRGGALTDQPSSLADIAPAEDEKTDPNTPFLADLHGEKPIGWRSAFMEICCCCWTP